MKKPKDLHWLNHGIFPGYTMFIYGYDYESVIKWLKDYHKKYPSEGADEWLVACESIELLKKENQAFCSIRTIVNKKGNEKEMTIIRIPSGFNFTDDDYCTLAHEVLHLCQYFLPTLTNDREIEAEAYFHSHIMRQCLNVIRKANGK